MAHKLTCPAYGNYQPPYERCNCGDEEAPPESFTSRRPCTAEDPMPPGDTGRWRHPDAAYAGTRGGGQSRTGRAPLYYVYACPHCGAETLQTRKT